MLSVVESDSTKADWILATTGQRAHAFIMRSKQEFIAVSAKVSRDLVAFVLVSYNSIPLERIEKKCLV